MGKHSRTVLLILTIVVLVSGCQKKSQAGDLAQALQATLNEQRQQRNIAGISAAVILPDGSMWLGAGGMSSDTEAMDATKVFGLSSVTKTYTAALVAQLAAEGVLSVDDPIAKWIPELAMLSGGINIRQLLNHTSGLYRYQLSEAYVARINSEPEKIWTPQEILEQFQGQPECEAGGCWGESAMDYIVLGLIIERATGITVAEHLHARFFDPLGLEHTYLYPEETYPVADMAHVWRDITGYGEYMDIMSTPSDLPLAAWFSSLWTAGGLHSTAEDLAIFVKALFENQVITPGALSAMLSEGTEIYPGVTYGYSVVVDEISGKRAYWHSGGAGYSSNYTYFPDDDLTIVILTNQMTNPGPIAFTLYETVTGQSLNPEATVETTPTVQP
ncbi:MAG: serine hydrolase domain-containing protein [Anaerolineae bacterium]|jgi:D-alanyl-D-alanine carboxypeptidase|nr:serine hydrolase domain-containing protein [Anaerolineae bacterium]